MDIQEPSDVEMLNDSQRKLLSAVSFKVILLIPTNNCEWYLFEFIERFSSQPQPYLRDETYMHKWLKGKESSSTVYMSYVYVIDLCLARKFHLDEAEAMLSKVVLSSLIMYYSRQYVAYLIRLTMSLCAAYGCAQSVGNG